MNKFKPEQPRTFSQAVRALRDKKVIACHRTQEALAFSVWRDGSQSALVERLVFNLDNPHWEEFTLNLLVDTDIGGVGGGFDDTGERGSLYVESEKAAPAASQAKWEF